jgi:hypothetical protein
MIAKGIAMIIIQIVTVAAISPRSWSFSPKLWDSLGALQWAAVISALILTIGAVIEYWAKLKLLALLICKWMLGRATAFDRCVLRKLIVHSLGPILVVLGIAGDFVFEGRAFIVEDRQEEQARAIVGSLRDEAEALKLKEDALDIKAGGLDARLQNASSKLTGIEQDVLAQGPRWRLLDLGRDEFIRSLKPFAGQKSTVVICGQGDSERMPFEQLLMDLFRKAGWANPGYQSWHGCPTMLSGGNEMYFVSASATRTQWLMPYGCRGSMSVPTTEEVAKAGRALCDVLNKLRISTMAWIEAPIQSPQTREQEIARANGFFYPLGGGGADNPAGLALEEPTTIFILVGPSQPMFENKKKRPSR